MLACLRCISFLNCTYAKDERCYARASQRPVSTTPSPESRDRNYPCLDNHRHVFPDSRPQNVHVASRAGLGVNGHLIVYGGSGDECKKSRGIRSRSSRLTGFYGDRHAAELSSELYLTLASVRANRTRRCRRALQGDLDSAVTR